MKHLTIDEIKKMISESVKVEHKEEDFTKFVALTFRAKNGREFDVEFDLMGEEMEIGDASFIPLQDAIYESIEYEIKFNGLDFATAHKEVIKEDEKMILKKLKFI